MKRYLSTGPLVLIQLFTPLTLIGNEERTPIVPGLRPNEAVLIGHYPYRTVAGDGTARTMYQIARLGYRSVREFQNASGLISDGIVGPLTVGLARVKYRGSFGLTAGHSSWSDSALSLSLDRDGAQVVLSIANSAGRDLAIVGELVYEEPAEALEFKKPTPSLIAQCSVKTDQGVGDGLRTLEFAAIDLRELRSQVTLDLAAALPTLRANETCWFHGGLRVLDSQLNVHWFDAGAVKYH